MRRLIFIFAAVLLCLLAVGCYTKLSHPKVDTMGSVHGEGRQCQDCHSDQEYYYHHYPYYYDSYWNYGNWWSYYCDPWWWGCDYWCWPDPEYGVPLPVERTQYYDDRGRPGERPVIVPGGSAAQSTDTDTPAKTDGGRNTSASDDNRRGRASQGRTTPTTRPPRPAKRPEKPKKKEAKQTKERE